MNDHTVYTVPLPNRRRAYLRMPDDYDWYDLRMAAAHVCLMVDAVRGDAPGTRWALEESQWQDPPERVEASADVAA